MIAGQIGMDRTMKRVTLQFPENFSIDWLSEFDCDIMVPRVPCVGDKINIFSGIIPPGGDPLRRESLMLRVVSVEFFIYGAILDGDVKKPGIIWNYEEDNYQDFDEFPPAADVHIGVEECLEDWVPHGG